MHETRAIQGKNGNKSSWWGLDNWEQFPYLTWENLPQSKSYFHEKQDRKFGFEDLDDVFIMDSWKKSNLIITSYLCIDDLHMFVKISG